MFTAHRPRKRFGQHFLHDAGVLARIVAAIAPRPSDALVEIGPGRGALSRHLLAAVGYLDAIELDRDLIPLLARSCRGLGELRIHQADALAFDLGGLRRAERRLRVVGNLPYNISTPLLFHLFAQAKHIDDMHFMLQKEVAERLAARPGTAAYGRLSVMAQYRARVEPLFQVGPGAFHPPPQVESAFVRLAPHPLPPVRIADEATFSTLVTQAFSQRRKTLRNSLRPWLAGAELEALGIDPRARAETLGLAEFAMLSNALSSGPLRPGAPQTRAMANQP
ncbi:MAG: 16S rRNA (adenine(1518)-N(6)/adenine(1519)-N(6))-dimethyltransferase RsmA [Gammaproteobacteria bacterium]